MSSELSRKESVTAPIFSPVPKDVRTEGSKPHHNEEIELMESSEKATSATCVSLPPSVPARPPARRIAKLLKSLDGQAANTNQQEIVTEITPKELPDPKSREFIRRIYFGNSLLLFAIRFEVCL